MTNIIKSLALVGGLGIGLAACSNNNGTTLTPQPPAPPNAKYAQIERLSRPAIKEVFEQFVDHQKSNATEPYDTANDPLFAAIKGTEDALRPPKNGADYGGLLQKVLYPDEYAVNLDGTAAGFLGVEVAPLNKSFGGRTATDDVIALELGALFGPTLGTLGLQPEDNQEDTCLSAQNLPSSAAETPTSTFPYLVAAH